MRSDAPEKRRGAGTPRAAIKNPGDIESIAHQRAGCEPAWVLELDAALSELLGAETSAAAHGALAGEILRAQWPDSLRLDAAHMRLDALEVDR